MPFAIESGVKKHEIISSLPTGWGRLGALGASILKSPKNGGRCAPNVTHVQLGAVGGKNGQFIKKILKFLFEKVVLLLFVRCQDDVLFAEFLPS